MKCITIITFITIIIFIFISPASALAATLSLSPSSGTFNRGCNFSLNIDLDTAGAQTDGTDAIVMYDPARFTALSISSGSIYPDYPGNNIDTAGGKITVSGLAAVATPFTGQGTLATISFQVPANAATGATQVKFDFDPNDKTKTTDSNVVERGTVADVLNSVVNGNYVVGTGSCAAQTPTGGGTTGGVGTTPGRGATGISTPSAGQAGTIDQIVGGKAGTPELTYTLAIVGLLLTAFGILGLALL